MKITLEMPAVTSCEAAQCAYNAKGTCNARAITVGNQMHPACDTFISRHAHVASRPEHTGVGACKTVACKHNEDLECQARAIKVGMHRAHADCLSFERG